MPVPDFTIPVFFVYVIESNRGQEILQGFSEGAALKESLKFSGVPAFYQPVLDRAMLQQALSQKLLPYCSGYQAFPILHISAHGCENGIALTMNEFVSWKELAAFLQPLHKQTSGSFLLAVSSCKGLTAVGIALTSPNGPFFGVVGTPENVSWLYRFLPSAEKRPNDKTSHRRNEGRIRA